MSPGAPKVRARDHVNVHDLIGMPRDCDDVLTLVSMATPCKHIRNQIKKSYTTLYVIKTYFSEVQTEAPLSMEICFCYERCGREATGVTFPRSRQYANLQYSQPSDLNHQPSTSQLWGFQPQVIRHHTLNNHYDNRGRQHEVVPVAVYKINTRGSYISCECIGVRRGK